MTVHNGTCRRVELWLGCVQILVTSGLPSCGSKLALSVKDSHSGTSVYFLSTRMVWYSEHMRNQRRHSDSSVTIIGVFSCPPPQRFVKIFFELMQEKKILKGFEKSDQP
jgi:hypothetical protein